MGRKRGKPMVLEIPGKLFGQDDVRETTTDPTSGTTTAFASIGPAAFTTSSPDVDDHIHNGATLVLTGAGLVVYGEIQLPHGATVTAAIVWSSVSTETWSLFENDLNGVGFASTLASASLNSEDTSITAPTVNNETSSYVFITQAMDAGDNIRGARVTYTI